MTATVHIGRRTTPHHPFASLRARWEAYTQRRTQRTQAAYFQRLHDTLPLDDPDRHDLDAPALEAAFAGLAISHPDEVAATTMRTADHEQLLLAARDEWFRHAHPAPEHRWSPEERAAYEALMATVHRSRPDGAS
ncbi:hypothetical protein ACIP4S_13305 [Streptomyces chartreusis]|uniref:hypothetical protein n=1 Tax=Streptomyces chartreusis TaxID=1969 RepID=UPI003804CDD8